MLAPRVGRSTMESRALRVATSVSSSVEGVEVAGQNDRRRRKRRRHSVYAGLNVVEQRSRLILWLWRMVQRADKHAVPRFLPQCQLGAYIARCIHYSVGKRSRVRRRALCSYDQQAME